MRIESNGIQLHVEQRGAGSPGLVFLHYWGGSTRTWRQVIDALAPDFRTIAIDQRGWGQSEAPTSGYALADMADDALTAIETLGLERYILIGHSMGGKVAQLIASRGPGGLIGLVLIAPAPPSPMDLPLEVRQGMVGAYASRESIIATVEQVLSPDGLGREDLEMVIADSLAGAPAAKEAWPLLTSQEDITAAVTAIDVPVMVLSGDHDRVDTPEVLRRELLPRIPQAQLFVLPNVGHLSPLEAPDAIADMISAFALSLTDDELRPSSAHRNLELYCCSECWAAYLAAVGLKKHRGSLTIHSNHQLTLKEIGMSTPEIIRIPILPFNMVNAHLIKSDAGAILVDTGIPGSERKIERVLDRNGLSFKDIKLIIVTHAHTDHAGSAARVRALSGAPILAHKDDVDFYTRKVPMTYCTTSWLAKLFLKTPVPHEPYEGFQPDILMENGDSMSLIDFGVDGVVSHTGGHTPGSIAIELSSRDVLAGDLIASGILIGGIAFTGRAIRPPFEDDPQLVSRELERLVKAGAQRFHLGHGGPLQAAEVLRHARVLANMTPGPCAAGCSKHASH